MKYEIEYNISEGTLQDNYRNWRELKNIRLPNKELTIEEVKIFIQKIPKNWLYQFRIYEYNEEEIGEDNLPTLISINNLEEWYYQINK